MKKIGAIQLTSVLNPEENLFKIRSFIKQAVSEKCDAVFLPEYFYSFDDGATLTPYLVEENNEHFQEIRSLSHQFKIWILGGSAPTKVGNLVHNRIYNFSPMSDHNLAPYDKIHLFECDFIDQGIRKKVAESDHFEAGNTPYLLDFDKLKIGMSLCFDMRFSDLYLQYRKAGANLLSVSSAFTVPTGRAHWHTLLRARAIENQCYVVAAAQVGKHNAAKETYGHSLIIDPWGEILADAGEKECLITAEIDVEKVAQVRKKVMM